MWFMIMVYYKYKVIVGLLSEKLAMEYALLNMSG